MGDRLSGKGLKSYFIDCKMQIEKGKLLAFPERIISGIYDRARNFTQFREWLEKAGIEIELTNNNEGGIQGITFINKHTGHVFNGSEIDLAAGTIYERFPPENEPDITDDISNDTVLHQTDPIAESAGISPHQGISDPISIVEEFLSMFDVVYSPQEYVDPHLRGLYKRKKKKKKQLKR